MSQPAERSPGRNLMARLTIASGGAILIWLLLTYSVSLLSLYLGTGIWPLTASLSLLVVPVWTFLAFEQENSRLPWKPALATALSLLVLGVSYWLAHASVDISWDGAAYQQEAILQLVDGWSNFPEPLAASTPYATMINSYPRASWIIAASIFRASGNLNAAKLIQFALLASSLLLMLGALLHERRLNGLPALLVATAAAANPIAIYQSHSFYVDGLIGSLITCLVALTLILLLRPARWHLGLLGALVILLINTKQTGIAYGGLICLAMLLLMFFVQRRWFLPVLGAATLAGVLGGLVYGYSPYVTNTLKHANPFYPVLGGGRDFEAGHRPPGYDDMPGLERLARSSFSAPTVQIQAPERLALPLTQVNAKTIAHFVNADIRLGGWGVLFSAALVLGVAGLLAIPWVPSGARAVGLTLLGALTLSVLINPEAWWARFVPQWVLVPLVPAALLLMTGRRLLQLWGLLVVAVLVANAALIGYSYFPFQAAYNAKLERQLEQILSIGRPITIHFGAFPANRRQLRDKGIRYQTAESREKLPCRQPHRLFAYEGWFCFAGER